MRRFGRVASGIAVAVLGACGATPDGTLRFELAVTGDRAAAAERVRERLAVVDDRADIALGDVDLSEAPPDRLVASVAVNGGAGCADFERARAAVREALTKPRQLSPREAQPIDAAFEATVQERLGPGASVRRDFGSPHLVVASGDGQDVTGALAGLRVGKAVAGIGVIEAGPMGPATYQIWALSPEPELRAGDIVDARADIDQLNQPFVRVELGRAEDVLEGNGDVEEALSRAARDGQVEVDRDVRVGEAGDGVGDGRVGGRGVREVDAIDEVATGGGRDGVDGDADAVRGGAIAVRVVIGVARPDPRDGAHAVTGAVGVEGALPDRVAALVRHGEGVADVGDAREIERRDPDREARAGGRR